MFSKFLNVLNDMSPRQLLILSGSLAVIVFFIIFYTLTLYTESNSKSIDDADKINLETTTEKVDETVSIVVAKSNINPRIKITEDMLQIKEVSKDLVPENAITDIAQVINRPVRTAIYSGDIITEQKIYQNINQAGFVGSIPSDCRAVSINVNDTTGVNGFAKPGDYVDLLLVEKGKDRVSTNILLQDVLLLGIDQSMNDSNENPDNDENKNSSANPSIATFALRPDEVLKLISASKLGEIYLMLRPYNPKEIYIDDINYTAISSVNKEEPKKNPQPSQPPQPVVPPTKSDLIIPVTQPNENPSDNDKIEIIQGDKIVQSPNKNHRTN